MWLHPQARTVSAAMPPRNAPPRVIRSRAHEGKDRGGHLELDLVDVAECPRLPGLERGDHRVAGMKRVLGRVAVGRIVAAADVPAAQAQAQVDPPAAGLQALLAALGRL